MRCFTRSTRAALAIMASAALTSFIGLNPAQAQTTTQYALDGRAVLENGTGIPNVTIRLDGTAKTALTNASGEYHFDGLPAGPIKVFARKEGYSFTPSLREITLPTAGEPYSPNARARFVGTPVTKYAVFGRVLNAEEAGVPNVAVTISKPSTTFAPRTLNTTTEGRYRFEEIPQGTYVLKPRKEGFRFEPAEAQVAVPTSGQEYSPSGRALFRAFKVSTLKVFGIVKTADSLPLANVKIYRGTAVETGAIPVATTNAEGRWAVENLAAGSYNFVPKLEGYRFEPRYGTASIPTSGLEWSPNGRLIFVGYKIDRFAIRGKVTNPSGVGIAGVTVRPGTLTITGTTNTNGEYVIEGLPAGNYSLAASKANFTFTPSAKLVTLPTTGETYSPHGKADFVGTEATSVKYSISGKVANASGVGISGVTVKIDGGGPSFVTGTSGEYTFGNLNAGSYTVFAVKTNFTFTPAHKTVTLPTAGEPYSPNGKANFVGAEQTTTSYAIRGKVFNGVGSALSGVTVKLGTAGPSIVTTTTGEFAFENLPAGTYTVYASRTNFTLTPASKTVTLPTSGLAVSPNARIEFVGREGTNTTTYSISGKVVKSGGTAIAGVEISLNDRTDPSAITNAEGRFTITGLPAGTYVLHLDLSHYDFQPATRTITLPTSGLTVSPNGFAEFIGSETDF